MIKRIKQKIRHFMCDILDWHSPTKNIRVDGINLKSYCKHCRRKIMQDSQVVDAWIKRNKINRKIPLHKLISNNPKPKEKVIKGQLTIFDIIGGKDEQ